MVPPGPTGFMAGPARCILPPLPLSLCLYLAESSLPLVFSLAPSVACVCVWSIDLHSFAGEVGMLIWEDFCTNDAAGGEIMELGGWHSGFWNRRLVGRLGCVLDTFCY